MLGHSASVRILAPPLASFPIPLVSAPVPASPYLRHANLGESVLRSAVSYRVSSARFRIRSDQVPSQHLKAMSMRLKQSRADHLRCFSSPFGVKPLTSKPWQFDSLALSAALRRFVSRQLKAVPIYAFSDQSRAWPRRFSLPPVRATRIHCLSERFGSQLRSAVATL